eukprot:15394243-Alexandrium_andersonii.AAC.1
MSASLVGSEMCIRDRPVAAVVRQGAGASRVGQAEGSRGLLRGGGPTSRPVSYTHLTLPTICSV